MKTARHGASYAEAVQVKIRRYEPGDAEQVRDLLFFVQQWTSHPEMAPGPYPPRHQAPTPDDIENYLEQNTLRRRWVAVTDSGTVVGHVAIGFCEDSDHLTPHLPKLARNEPITGLMEVSRLFAVPKQLLPGHRIGERLLREAQRAIAEEFGRRPVLCVLETGTNAIALYHRAGWRKIGEVIGKSGINNHIFLGPVHQAQPRQSQSRSTLAPPAADIRTSLVADGINKAV